MTYTDNPNEIVFLNDKNIVQGLTGDTPDYNGVPSQALFKATYDELSAYDKALSDKIKEYEGSANLSIDNLCAELGSYELSAEKQFKDLSGWLGDRVELSVSDISAALGVQQVSSESLQTQIDEFKTAVDEDYVHVSGDTVSGDVKILRNLDVASQLSVVGQTVIDGKIVIKGNLTQGESTSVTNVTRGVALGISAVVQHDDSFVWNGSDQTVEYSSHGPDGTFNVNPESGTKGFYVGEETLSDIIHNDSALSVAGLESRMDGISAALSAKIDENREADSTWLSAAAVKYSDGISAALSAKIDENRASDRTELSAALSGYSNDLCAAVSAAVDADKYGVAATLSISYDKDTRNIGVQITDKFGNTSKSELSFDDVTGSQIVDRVEVLTPPDVEVATIRIWWMPQPEAGEDQRSTDIPIQDLAQVYTAGEGIDIASDLTISATSVLARTADLTALSVYVHSDLEKRLTADEENISAVTSHAADIQTYINELSGYPGQTTAAIIPTINSDIAYVSSFISDDLEKRLVADEENISAVSAHADDIQTYVEELSGKDRIIDTLSSNVADIYEKIKHEVAFVGHIEVNTIAETQAWVSEHGNQLSSIFKHFNFAEDNKVKNGNVYDVKFTNVPDDKIDTLKELYYDTDEQDGSKFRISDGDYLVVHSCDGAEYVDIGSIGPDTVRVVTGVKRYEHFGLSAATRDNYFWLSGGNSLTAEWDTGHADHSIGGDNDFLGYNRFEQISVHALSAEILSAYALSASKLSGHDVDIDDLSVYYAKANSVSAHGLSAEILSAYALSASKLSGNDVEIDDLSVYYAKADSVSAYGLSAEILSAAALSASKLSGKDVEIDDLSVHYAKADSVSAYSLSAEILSAYALSASKLSGHDVDIDDLSVYYAKANSVSAHGLSADGLSAGDAKITALAAGAITADWNDVVHPTGYSLFQLSTDLSNKIYIEDRVDGTVSGTSDLSIVKLSKTEYDTLVATKADTMSANVLYVVDSPMIDAYGQVISNLTMTDLSTPSEAATQEYVDAIKNKLSTFTALGEKFNATLTSDDPMDLSGVQMSSLVGLLIDVKNALSTFLTA